MVNNNIYFFISVLLQFCPNAFPRSPGNLILPGENVENLSRISTQFALICANKISNASIVVQNTCYFVNFEFKQNKSMPISKSP